MRRFRLWGVGPDGLDPQLAILLGEIVLKGAGEAGHALQLVARLEAVEVRDDRAAAVLRDDGGDRISRRSPAEVVPREVELILGRDVVAQPQAADVHVGTHRDFITLAIEIPGARGDARVRARAMPQVVSIAVAPEQVEL